MDYSRAFAISSAGMAVERTRVEVAALNLANANTVQTADGARFQPVRVVAHGTDRGCSNRRPLQTGQRNLLLLAKVVEASTGEFRGGEYLEEA